MHRYQLPCPVYVIEEKVWWVLGCLAASPALVITPFKLCVVRAAELAVSTLSLLYVLSRVIFCCGKSYYFSIFFLTYAIDFPLRNRAV